MKSAWKSRFSIQIAREGSMRRSLAASSLFCSASDGRVFLSCALSTTWAPTSRVCSLIFNSLCRLVAFVCSLDRV